MMPLLPGTRAWSHQNRCLLLGPVLILAVAGCNPSVPDLLKQTVHWIASKEEVVLESFDLEAGDYVRAVVTPRQEVDLALALELPAASPTRRREPSPPGPCAGPIKSDASPARGQFAAEEIAWVAEVPGTYRLKICSFDRPGTYTLKVWGPRPHRLGDKLRAFSIYTSIRAERAADNLTPEDWLRRIDQLRHGPLLWQGRDSQRNADAHYFLGEAYQETGRLGEAFSHFSRARKLYTRIGQSFAEAQTRNRLGLLHGMQGREAKALKELTAGLDVFHPRDEDLEGKKLQATLLNNRGDIRLDLAELEEAIADLEHARELHETLKDQVRLASTLVNLGSAYDLRRDRPRSKEALERALEIAEAQEGRLASVAQRRMNTETRAAAQNGLGIYYLTAGDWNRAARAFEEAVRLNELLGNLVPAQIARTSNNLARAYQRAGQPDRARHVYSRALKVVGQHDRVARVHILTNLASLELDSGGHEAALKYVRRALKAAGTEGRLRISPLEVEGAIHRARKELPKARQALEEALELTEGPRDSQYPALLLELAHVELLSAELRTARAKIEEAVSLIESSREQFQGEDLKAFHRAARSDYYDLYIRILMAQGEESTAFTVSESARAQSLLETLGERQFDLKADASPNLLRRSRELLEGVRAARFRISRLRERRSSASEVRKAEKELDELSQRLLDVEVDIRAESSRRYANLKKPEPLTAGEIQRIVGDDALLLEYWLGKEQGVVWAVTGQDIRSFEVHEPRKAIEERTKCYLEALKATGLPLKKRQGPCQSPEDLRASGAWLSEKLLAPVGPNLGERPLLIVADGALHYIPFAALPDPASPERRLFERHEIVNLPSATVLAALREETRGRDAPPLSAAVFANPVLQGTDPRVRRRSQPDPGRRPGTEVPAGETVSPWAPLPETEREAETLCRLLRPATCDMWSGFEASSATVKSRDLSQYRLVHFATHGHILSDAPALSGLVLSLVDEAGRNQDGFLTLYDIYNLRLQADLVTLSACETGLGREIRGEGLIGLTRGFMYAGSKRVLASLWSVNSKATQVLMEKFYRHHVQEKMTPAQALRAAQIEMSAKPKGTSTDWSAPYYWAGFTLQGEWQ